ncbi:hypothetical protein BAUCODRAFT_129711 [Baudoinia panamericana UAMH 10762]|uniref:Uncharacterized protein n=1 Tax=Baudoinia panamericana (strain UAMH 10762) TaxID=717646 RepID=M2MMJ0_BAUPA|nr:uncharacterized protein BAUCODRAFT_129711 [Baudoinia panamericana UAMH 10762]EMC97911.1 hypothetical protein BAUCODRAFT_129711 [Baudoinia panamericana UAMH 10762]
MSVRYLDEHTLLEGHQPSKPSQHSPKSLQRPEMASVAMLLLFYFSEPQTGFPRIDKLMDKTRTWYATHPEIVASIQADAHAELPRQLPPTPEVLDCNERVDRAISHSQHHITEAKEQAAGPVSDHLSEDLTDAELDEQRNAEKWHARYTAADQLTNGLLASSQKLFEAVSDLISETQADEIAILNNTRVPDAPPSPSLGWLSLPLDVKQWVAESVKPGSLHVTGMLAPKTRSFGVFDSRLHAKRAWSLTYLNRS